MNSPVQNVQTLLTEQFRQIAPDIDLTEVDRDEDLRDEFDIDSIDFLNLITALGNAVGTEIPEADYPKIKTLNLLEAHMKQIIQDIDREDH